MSNHCSFVPASMDLMVHYSAYNSCLMTWWNDQIAANWYPIVDVSIPWWVRITVVPSIGLAKRPLSSQLDSSAAGNQYGGGLVFSEDCVFSLFMKMWVHVGRHKWTSIWFVLLTFSDLLHRNLSCLSETIYWDNFIWRKWIYLWIPVAFIHWCLSYSFVGAKDRHLKQWWYND